MPTVEDAKTQMEAALEALRREFATVRTGKATPALLDTVRVEAYGSQMPLNQLATISTPESSLLVVQPFDKTLLPDLHRMTEEGRISIRHARRAVRDELHQLVRDHELSQDESRRREDQLEKLTKDYVEKVDEILKSKEAEVMAI